MTTVNARLKQLREGAFPPLSARALAAALGISKSAYHLYESDRGFKQRFLPMELSRRIASILKDHGVNPDDILALAGVGIDEAAGPALSAGEESLIDSFRRLTPAQRRAVMVLINAMDRGAEEDERQETVHSPRSEYRVGAGT